MSFFSTLVWIISYPCAVLGLLLKCVFSWICCFSRSGRVVGIFSRSSSDDYKWLTKALSSPMFKKCVQESRSVYISNREEHRFREAVQECDFKILYHTKNQGRINITNVMDSLYDSELQYMSSHKGRMNVVVVVDDLEKGDDEEKQRIQQYQPDIMTYAQDLILVTGNEKHQPQLLDRKLQQIKALVSGGSWSVGGFWDYLVSMTVWVCSATSRRRWSDDLDAPLLA